MQPLALLFLFSARLTFPHSKSSFKSLYNFFRLVVFDFGVYIHSNLAVFVTSQILNRLWINTSSDQIGDIGVPQLVRSYFEIERIDYISIVSCLLSKLRI